jgi:hypothetical protein
MFHSSQGVFQANEGIFCATDAAVPDELRVVVASLEPTSNLYVRVLTAGVSNDVHDYHNRALLASKVAATVTDAGGSVAATLVAVASVTVASGTYAAYALTLARSVTPTELSSVSVLSPYVRVTMATTAPAALTALKPRIELALDAPITPVVPWAPSAALGVTAPAMPAGGHKLVVDEAVTLRFAFDASESFGAGAAASFSATVNGAALSLASATVDGKSLCLAFTASSVAKHTFVFVAFGTVFVFVVDATQVYVFPTIVSTTRSVPVVTLGATLVVTSTFDAELPGGATATALVTATGQAAVGLAASVAGTAVSVAHTVLYDVAHAGIVTLAYGSTSKEYSWGAGALTSAQIYTFPSAFAYSTGTFGTGLSLRQGVSGALTLTFGGGDMLHSSVVSAQVEYVKFAQGSSEGNASVETCSDPLETVGVTLVPQATTDLTLRVKLRGPDGTLSGEITRAVPSAEIAPSWLPTSVTSVSSDVPLPHKLVVGSAARLTFSFASNGDLSSSAISDFAMYVDGSVASLDGASVSGRTLSVAYTAGSIATRAFEFRARGQSVVAAIGSSEVYAFPSVVSTAKGTAVVTLGSAVDLTTTFGASLPSAMTATVSVTSGGAPTIVTALPSGASATASFTVLSDVAHAAVVTLAYGPATHEYAWSTSALTTAEIYTFPSAFTVAGWLHQLTPRALTLTFSGGDLLHSSVVATQVAYVKYAQGSTETTVDESGNSCSASAATVTLGSVAPSELADVTVKVALLAPDGAVGTELTRTILAGAIAPQWVPTAAGSVASNVSSAHKLVVGSEVQLTFSFVAGADFPTTVASTLFAFRVDGTVTTLAGAVVNVGARTVRVAYTAASVTAVAFEFSTGYGSSYAFAVGAAEVYAFPTMSSTTRGVSVVTVGQTLALTSLFSAALTSGTTAAVSIVPAGYAAVLPVASVSGSSVTYSVSVAYDVVHTGTVTLAYGAAQREYSWAAGTMTAAHIYTFPSAFTYDGTANGLGSGMSLKEGTSGTLTLTFTGGDLLHSSVASTQVEYAKFAQSGVETTIASASLACSDPLETVTVSDMTPASTADLTLKVKLRGPDGALSSEITAVVPSAQIVASVEAMVSIYNVNARTRAKTSGFSSDSRSGSLIVALPLDAETEVSSQINPATNAKTVTWRSGYVTTGTSRYYGSSYTMRTTATTAGVFSSVLVGGFATPMAAYFNGDFTLEMWIRPTSNSGGTSTGNVILQTGESGEPAQISMLCESAVVAAGESLLLDTGDLASYNGSGTWNDISGNTGRNGTLLYGPTYIACPAGRTGMCISFDGSDDRVVGSIPSSVSGSAHTISCLFYHTGGSPWSAVVSLNSGVVGASALGFVGNQNVMGVNRIAVDMTSVASVNLGSHMNTWIYATVVYEGVTSGSNVKVYVYKAGVLLPVGTGTLYWNLTQSSSYLVGRVCDASDNFGGHIAHVAVYPRALTATEIGQNYTAVIGNAVRYSSGLGRVNMYNGISAVTYYGTRVITSDTWHHVALVRIGSTFVVYVNGVSVLSLPAWTMQTMTRFCVGGKNLTSYEHQDFFGNVQDFRMYSAAKYTGAFTVPSATYAAVTTLASLSDTGTGIEPALVATQTTQCRVTVSGGSYDMNIASDFTVFFAAAGSSLATIQAVSAPYNCAVSAYDSVTGALTFAATPATSGSVMLVVRCLSGSGSGALAATLTLAVASAVAAAPRGTWSPTQITTAMWLDASDSTTLTAVSGVISEWRDKSGNARHAAQTTASYRPGTATVNGLAVLSFDGANDYMDIATSALHGQLAPNLFYVFVRNNAGSGGDGYRPEISILPSSGSDNGAFHYINPGGYGASYPNNTRGWGNYDLGSGTPYTTGSVELISFAVAAGQWRVYRNGTSEGTSGTVTTALGSDAAGMRLAQQYGGRTSGISLAEIVMVFDASLANRERVEGYLAWKWGVQAKLPSSHAYSSNSP